MQRIVKRFLLHNQRESNEGFRKGFMELKQDLQLCRYELLNGMKMKKDNAFHVQNLIHAGLNILGDELFRKKHTKLSEQNLANFMEYKSFSSEITMHDETLANFNNPAAHVVTREKVLGEKAKKVLFAYLIETRCLRKILNVFFSSFILLLD
jgi:hypothetical protein